MTKLFPNLFLYWDEFILSIQETLWMLGLSGVFVLIFGLVLGVLLIVTKKDGLFEHRLFYQVLDKTVNIFRSIPFVILITAVIPLTRLLVGNPLGIKGAIPALIIAASPFFARQVALALTDIDQGLIEAAESMGDSPLQIIFKVYLKESLPALIQGFAITIISLFGLTTISGTMGAGGLGAFVKRYGHGRFMGDITFVSVLVIILFVSSVQGLASLLIEKLSNE